MRSGGKDYRTPAPVAALQGLKVTKVACGDFHSVALTSEGRLFSWGGGGSFFNRGQCGHGNNQDSDSPELIKSLQHKVIVNLVCGGYHTLALSSDNELYSWGSGLYGECGFGAFVHSNVPRQVPFSASKGSASFDVCPGVRARIGWRRHRGRHSHHEKRNFVARPASGNSSDQGHSGRRPPFDSSHRYSRAVVESG